MAFIVLHEANVMHRDLKPDNILFDGNYEVKVSDFGLSKSTQKGVNLRNTAAEVGTPHYRAPETLAGFDYDHNIDVFAFGQVIYQVMTGKQLFPGLTNANQIYTEIAGGRLPDFPRELSPLLANLVRRCWKATPSERPSFREIAEILSSRELMNAIRGLSRTIYREYRERISVPGEIATPVDSRDRESESDDVESQQLRNALELARDQLAVQNAACERMKAESQHLTKALALAQGQLMEKGAECENMLAESQQLRNSLALTDRQLGMKNAECERMRAESQRLRNEAELAPGQLAVKNAECERMRVELEELDTRKGEFALRLFVTQKAPLMCFQPRNPMSEVESATLIEREKANVAGHYHRLADQGDAEGENNYGLCLMTGFGVTENRRAAAGFFQRSAYHRSPCGQCNFGRCLLHGIGVRTNPGAAARLLQTSADQGHSVGQYFYGICLWDGVGVGRNLEMAADYFKRSADQGNRDGRIMYGKCRRDGTGAVKDPEEAMRYFQLVADEGDCEGLNLYGDGLRDGIGVQQNLIGAVNCFRLSADQGDSGGQFRYAECLYSGTGVAKDRRAAATYFKSSGQRRKRRWNLFRI
jgi:TPR repeat protein